MSDGIRTSIKHLGEHRASFVAVAALAWVGVFALTSLTPLIQDDYWYSFFFARWTPLNTMADVIASQIDHWRLWGGRSVAHTVAQTFLMLGKPAFNVANACAFVALAVGIYFHCTARRRRSLGLFVGILLALWFCLPAFAETVLWLDGSANYLWTALVVVWFLLPYRIFADRLLGRGITCHLHGSRSAAAAVGMLIAGVIAGWTNENTGLAFIITLAVLLVVLKRKGGRGLPPWTVCGFVGTLIGCVILFAAPGNYVKTPGLTTVYSFFDDPLLSIVMALYLSLKYIFPLIIAYVVFLVIRCRGGVPFRRAFAPTFFYVIAAIMCIGAMMFSPEIPDRAFFGASVFTIIGCGIAYLDLADDVRAGSVSVARWASAMGTVCFAAVLVLFAVTFSYAVVDNARTATLSDERVASITAQRNAGVEDVTVERIHSDTRYNVFSSLSDVNVDPGNWVNKGWVEYYGLSSIRGVEGDA